MISDTLTGAHEPLQQVNRSHFTFEMYAPNSISESGVPMMDRVNIQFSAVGLHLEDVVQKFEDFLRASGYVFDGKCLELVDK